jgi:hypothetical protein
MRKMLDVQLERAPSWEAYLHPPRPVCRGLQKELRVFPPHSARRQSPQLPLWAEQDMNDIQWHKVKQLRPYAVRKRQNFCGLIQTSLFA